MAAFGSRPIGESIGVTFGGDSGGMQLFSNAYLFAGGTLIAMAASIQIEKKSNSTPIHTLHRGFAGQCHGSGTTELTVEQAIPTKDFELIGGSLVDFWVASGLPVDFGIIMGARTTRLKGIVDSASYSHSVNDASKVSFHVIGRFEPFE